MLFRESDVRARAQKEKSKYLYKSESAILTESFESFQESKTYDIFLSHSSKDAQIILGIKGILEDLGCSVYVDWVDDPQLDRSKVDKTTAELLKKRMKVSKSLFYVTTENSTNSKWMPWECGYFDGFKEKVAITPVVKFPSDNDFKGQEYLGLYPYSVKMNDTLGKKTLWILKDKSTYTSYSNWVSTKNESIEWKNL